MGFKLLLLAAEVVSQGAGDQKCGAPAVTRQSGVR